MSTTEHMAIDFKNFTSHPMGCENKNTRHASARRVKGLPALIHECRGCEHSRDLPGPAGTNAE
ncbi:hypothetical protein [Limnohabitans sp.]